MFNLYIPLRIAQAVLSLIVLGTAAYCVDIAVGGYPEAAFLVWSCVWSWLVLAYLLLAPMYKPNLHNRWVVLGLESVTMIFWFAGFIAMAASTSHMVCLPNWGAGCTFIGAAKAAAAFACFEWICWAATLGLIIHAMIQVRKGDHGPDPDAGNANTFSSNFTNFFSRKKQQQQGTGVEMGGGGQMPQYTPEEALPKLPEMAHNTTETTSNEFTFPAAKDFGGYGEHV